MKSNTNLKFDIMEGVPGPGGVLQNEYRLSGRRAVRHVLRSHKARHLGGYSLIERDIRNIRTWIAEIIALQSTLPPGVEGRENQKRLGDAHTNDIIKGLFVAALTTYAKLYPPARGRLVCLDPALIKDPEKRQIHEELLSFRHNFAAHSGDERRERCEVVVALAPTPDGGVMSSLICELSQPSSWGIAYYKRVDALLAELHDYAKRKKEELYGEVHAESLNDQERQSIVDLYVKAGVWKEERRPERKGP